MTAHLWSKCWATERPECPSSRLNCRAVVILNQCNLLWKLKSWEFSFSRSFFWSDDPINSYFGRSPLYLHRFVLARCSLVLLCLPYTLHPHRRPSGRGGRGCRPPQPCGGGRRSSLLWACSSARRGSQLSEGCISFSEPLKALSINDKENN